MPISTINTTGTYSEMKVNELVKMINEQYVPSIEESFQSIIVHLKSAHVVEPKEEEVNYLMNHVKRLAEKFSVHAHREQQELFPVHHLFYADDHKHGKNAAVLLAECIREHENFRNELALLHKLSAEFHCDVTSSPSHKLAYAQMSVLEQDLHRLFFLEEQFLFPKLKRSIQNRRT